MRKNKELIYIPVILLFILLAGSLITVNAQHCQYDFYRLIGIIPYFNESTVITDKLKITLVDKAGNPIIMNQQGKNRYAGSANLPLEFWRNPPRNRDKEHGRRNIKRRHFAFADNHYILAFNTGQGKSASHYIKIEDTDGEQNGGHFMTQVIEIPENYQMALCGYNLYSTRHGQYYHPMQIQMVALKDSNLKKIKNVSVNQYSKITSGYRYELTFNPADAVLPAEKGSYAKKLCIYDLKDNYLVYQQIILGNNLKETHIQTDSFDILQINFDEIPDVRFRHHNNTCTYILSAKNEEETNIFYRENGLYDMPEFIRDTEKKQLTAKKYEDNYETTKIFRGKYLDTLIKFQQTRQRPVYAIQYYFINKQGKLTQIRNEKPGSEHVPPIHKKEFGDYNFDGYEDYRIQVFEGETEWDYYLYDQQRQYFIFHPLLSKMQSAYFDTKNAKFYGTIVTRRDTKTYETDYFEYINNVLCIVQRRSCRQKSDHSERSDCDIYILKDGKLVFKETQRGAE